MGVADRVLRERKKKAGTFWSLEEVVGIMRRKEVKKEKCKGTCVEEKNRGEKRRRKKCGSVWRTKKEGKKKKKKEMVSQYFYNTFTINFKW